MTDRGALHICFVSTMHPPDDKRVHQKEARALVRAGFRVSHVVRDAGQGAELDGVRQLIFTAEGRSLSARLTRMARIFALARRSGADVFHCNEADSWAIGLALRLLTRARVVHDVHEIYSSDLAESRFPPWARPAVQGILRAVFAPMTLLTDRFVLAKGSVAVDYPLLSSRKSVVVANYVELGDNPPMADHARAPDDAQIEVLHLGAINRQRGWPQMLDALDGAQNRKLQLTVIGWFGDGSEDAFLEAVAERGLEEQVSFLGKVPYDAVPEACAKADIGLIAFQPVMLNFRHALPHKLFDYMLAGLPVIVPDFAVEVSQIVREADCGLIVDPSDPTAIAAAMDRLAGDPGLRARLGANGHRAVHRRYNWTVEAERLVAFYDDCATAWTRPAHARTDPATDKRNAR